MNGTLSVLLMSIVLPCLIVAIPIRRFVKYVRKDIELHQKEKEKKIELLQAQIDSLKEGKGTYW